MTTVLLIITAMLLIVMIYYFLPKAQLAAEVDFQRLVLPTTPNFYLACPLDYCQVEHAEAPIFNLPLVELADKWQQLMAQQPRLTVLTSDPENFQYSYIQRTQWLRFPDYVYVKLIALGPERSSIVIFSRSKYGYSDFGVNQQRVQHWLQQLTYPSAAKASHLRQ